MLNEKRKTGLSNLAEVSWGTHLCQFYQTKEDLLEILIPYFREGLKQQEQCIWITSEPLSADEARTELGKEVDNLDTYFQKGQIEITDYQKWYTRTGSYSLNKILNDWVQKEEGVFKQGFAGLRVSGNPFVPEKKNWEEFVQDEETVKHVISRYKMLAVCTYSLDSCNAIEMLDVIKNHHYTLIRRKQKWEVAETNELVFFIEALQMSEKRYSSLFDNMNSAFAYHKILTDNNGIPIDYIFLEINKAFENLTGLTREKIIGRRVTTVIPDIKKESLDWIGIYGKVALTGEAFEFDAYFKPLDRWYLIKAYSPQRGYFAAIFDDITGRKKDEEMLRYRQEQLDMAVTGSEAGFWDLKVSLTESGLNIEDAYLSPGLKSFIGYTDNEFPNSFQAWQERIVPDESPMLNSSMEDYLAGCIDLHDCEYRTRHKDGSIRWLHSKGKLFRDRHGNPSRIISIEWDITEKKLAEQALEQLVEVKTREVLQLQSQIQTEAAKHKRLSDIGTLAATVAHELRNPLAVIRLASHNLRRKSDNIALHKHINTIDQKIEESDQIINNLLFYSRLKFSQLEKINLYDNLREVIETSKVHNRKKKVILLTEIGLIKDIYILADPLQIKELFANLLNNAYDAIASSDADAASGASASDDSIKATDISGKQCTIEIEAALHQADTIDVSISDNGIGIEKEILDKIWEPFFSTKSKGTGLGLTVCSQIVKLHNGSIEIESEKGKGTTVTVRFPRA